LIKIHIVTPQYNEEKGLSLKRGIVCNPSTFGVWFIWIVVGDQTMIPLGRIILKKCSL